MRRKEEWIKRWINNRMRFTAAAFLTVLITAAAYVCDPLRVLPVEAGNDNSDISDISDVSDVSVPVISGISFPQDENGDGWLNGEELSDSGVRISVTVDAGASAELKGFIYTVESGGDVLESGTAAAEDCVYDEESSAYTFMTQDVYPDSAEFLWTVQAEDVLGGVSEAVSSDAVRIDTTAPGSEGYICFTSDISEQASGESEADVWTSGFQEIFTYEWDTIWGRRTVDFEIRLEDQTSGISELTLVLFSGDEEIVYSTVEGGSRLLETSAEDGTCVFKGSVEADPDAEAEVSDFAVVSITDNAGNTWGEDAFYLRKASEGSLICLDGVNPRLVSVDADGVDLTENTVNYFTDDVTVVLGICESGFEYGEEPPAVYIYSRLSSGEDFDLEKVLTELEWDGAGDGCRYAGFTLEKSAGTEKEYFVKVSYRDTAGNLLVDGTGGGAASDGVYTGNVIVIDDRAPVLVSYEINEPAGVTADGVPVYENDGTGDDVRISFVLDENPDYIDDCQGLCIEVYEKNEGTGNDVPVASTEGTDGLLQLSVKRDYRSDRTYVFSFGFDGSPEEAEGEYYVRISYTDAAGNSLEDGLYTGSSFIIDHVSPTVEITYNEAYQVTDASNATVECRTPLKNHISYYGTDESEIVMTVVIEEKYPAVTESDGTVELAGFTLTVNGVETGVSWEHESGSCTYTAVYTVAAEGDYVFCVSFEDIAGNGMTAGTTVQGGGVSDGTYSSPVLVLDLTAPVIAVTYSADASAEYEGRKYFNESVNMVIEVTDENIRYGELKSVISNLTAADIDGQSVEETAASAKAEIINELGYARGTWKTKLSLSTEANYVIPIGFTDLAGNTASGTVEYVTVDLTAPEGLYLEYSETAAVNYFPFGWLFSSERITIKATASDSVSGLRYLRFTITDEDGEVTVKTRKLNPSGDGTYRVTIPSDTEDFKGSVMVEAVDWSGNAAFETKNYVSESEGLHEEAGRVSVTTLTEPSGSYGGVDFYNTDVSFTISIEDSYSGIAEYSYEGGYTLEGGYSYAGEAGYDTDRSAVTDPTYSFSETLTLDAAANNENGILVRAEYTDNAGQTGAASETYNIDVTQPEITVEYDLNEPLNGVYYNQTRTAVIIIRERNFDSSLVSIDITNTEGLLPSVSGWSSSGSGDDTLNICTVSFSEDGDYTFTVSCTDMAGNSAAYGCTDSFTIDQTLPVISLEWDNCSSQNGYYYSEGRTAAIDILEHNFDESSVEINISAGGDALYVPSVTGWAQNGDHYTAYVYFRDDGEYTINIGCTDLAGNPSLDDAEEYFIVDQTAPVIEIIGVEDASANNAEVMPEVWYSDTNLGDSEAVICLTGAKNADMDISGQSCRTGVSAGFLLNDFEYTEENDDLYTLEAYVYDLAGNRSEASIIFSVNRYGSVYTFDSATEELVGNAGNSGISYINSEQDIVVIETNVDTLEFVSITLNHDGELKTLEEGTDYEIAESGTDLSWKQYTYKVSSSNFEEEGTYTLTFYSRDRAENVSDNGSRGKKVEFVIDRTAPNILVSGVEDGGRYSDASKEITVYISDNILVSDACITLNGEASNYDAADIAKAEGLITLTAGGRGDFQELIVSACDAAGNTAEEVELKFLVSPNILVQYYMNKPVFYGSLAASVVTAAVCAALIRRKKRRRK